MLVLLITYFLDLPVYYFSMSINAVLFIMAVLNLAYFSDIFFASTIAYVFIGILARSNTLYYSEIMTDNAYTLFIIFSCIYLVCKKNSKIINSDDQLEEIIYDIEENYYEEKEVERLSGNLSSMSI